MEGKLNQITEVVRYITKNQDYIIKGNWFCQHWWCKHDLQCQNEKECKNKCPHEPQCQTEMRCQNKWTCKHRPICTTREQCQGKWTCRHKPVCQNKWFCRKNWKCQHPSRCQDIWECKYKWTEEYEPHCQGSWQCYHEQKCRKKLECQNKPPHYKWKCPHNFECYNKWQCQNRWQCQHKEKCDMRNHRLKWKCKTKCQHRCENETECLKKSPQGPKRQYKDEWKCRHQCENTRECQKKWKCSHEHYTYECEDEWKCRTRLWKCQHDPPCVMNECQAKWERESEWNCKHKKECPSNWQCLSDPEYQNKWQCQNRWTLGYSQDELKEILEKPRQLCDFFTQQCKECNKDSLISSFLLYKKQTLQCEIICHLVWVKAKETKGNVLYRVFGKWKCNKKHYWDSSYTWISLPKFIEKCQTFSERDFCMIECHKCWRKGSILSWERIVGSKDGPLHERALCEKCQSGEICVQKNTYFGQRA